MRQKTNNYFKSGKHVRAVSGSDSVVRPQILPQPAVQGLFALSEGGAALLGPGDGAGCENAV